MKKFVIVMVSIMVLFVFIMLNYLLWDKENLLEQRDSDKIEQNWLRGQNRTLQSTVEELEQSITELQDERDVQKSKIIALENSLRQALEKENSNIQEISEQSDALNTYKQFMQEEVKDIAVSWFSDITKNRLEESFEYVDEEFTLLGKNYDKEDYIEYISGIESIYIAQNDNDEEKSFVVLQEDGQPYEISVWIRVYASIKHEYEEKYKLQTGINNLKLLFRYNPDLNSWAIKSVTDA